MPLWAAVCGSNLTQPQYAYTWPTSPIIDPITPNVFLFFFCFVLFCLFVVVFFFWGWGGGGGGADSRVIFFSINPLDDLILFVCLRVGA